MKSLLPVACSFLLSTVTFAQQPTFTAGTKTVVVPITVRDSRGHFVPGLTATDFEIADDGAKRDVKQLSTDHVPISLGVLVDMSGSMQVRWTETRKALELLTQRLTPQDEIFLSAFNDKPVLVMPWTNDHERILSAFERLRPTGNTAISRALVLLSPMFQLARNSRKVFILVSDGNDTTAGPIITTTGGSFPMPSGAQSAIDQAQRTAGRIADERDRAPMVAAARRAAMVQEALRKSNAMVDAIGIDAPDVPKAARLDVDQLKTLTKPTGGYVEAIHSTEEISAAVTRICDDLQAQYVLGFEPTQLDGKFHEIKVKVKKPGLQMRAREGYVAAP